MRRPAAGSGKAGEQMRGGKIRFKNPSNQFSILDDILNRPYAEGFSIPAPSPYAVLEATKA